MDPNKIAKPDCVEHYEQVALFSWLSIVANYGIAAADDPLTYSQKGYALETYGQSNAIPEVRWVHAIPNGGSRGSTKEQAQKVGAALKAEGVKSGVSDIFVPIPRHGLHGLYIEMKRADGGTLSDTQKEFGAFAKSQGYGFFCAHGWKEAAECIRQWLSPCQSGA